MIPTQDQISPREIYGIFSENLKKLVQRKDVSVTRICQELGVNRTQFNRYLAGQASPRPDILHRICIYFQVDARVLLEPLPLVSDIKAQQVDRWSRGKPFRDFILSDHDRMKLVHPVRLGVHRYWQRSSLHKDWVNSYTIRLFQLDGATVFRAHADPRRDKVLNTHPVSRSHEVRGFFMSQVDGVVMLAFQEDNQRMSMSYLSVLSADSPVLPGIVLITRPELTQATRVERCVLEYLPQGKGLRLALRDRGGRAMADLPDFISHGLRGKVR
ncbi:helix-turn-helix domain-containing protein [Aliiroseovarius crassostreae]|uniref:helix-turn-helix domain-containing protein n=1 Tax=Aliiroseovarius crassostreae TaxID=154981 RepID=UPI003C7D3C8B